MKFMLFIFLAIPLFLFSQVPDGYTEWWRKGKNIITDGQHKVKSWTGLNGKILNDTLSVTVDHGGMSFTGSNSDINQNIDDSDFSFGTNNFTVIAKIKYRGDAGTGQNRV